MKLEEINDSKKEQVKAMYEQFKLGLLNEAEKQEMRNLALEYFMEKYW